MSKVIRIQKRKSKKTKKRKKIVYRDKSFNMDTLAINAVQTANALGVHAPQEININKLKRKPGAFISC